MHSGFSANMCIEPGSKQCCLFCGQLKKVTKALDDAEQCIKLKPEWEKGYFRKGAVLEDQEQFAEVRRHDQTV